LRRFIRGSFSRRRRGEKELTGARLRLNRVEKAVLRVLQKESNRIAKNEGIKKPSITVGVFYRCWDGLFLPPDTIILDVNMLRRFSKTGLLSDFMRILHVFYHEVGHMVQYRENEREADRYVARMVARRKDFLLSTHGKLLSMIFSRLSKKERRRLEKKVLKEILDAMLPNA
jgi:hypothetical protein